MSTESRNPGYEVRDVRVRAIVLWFAVLAVVVIASFFIVAGLGRALHVESKELSPLFVRPEPATPKLQTNPTQELLEYRAYERSMIGGYEWVQRGRVARVPVTRGMEILLQRGLPVRGASRPTGDATPGGEM